MKKKIAIIVGIIILILLATNLLSMADLKAEISSSAIDVKGGQEVTITLKFNEYKEIKNGLNAYKATLEYNNDIFEEVTQENFVCQNNWERLKYNKSTGEFVAIKKVGSNEPEEVVKITLKAKEALKATITNVKIKDIVTSEGEKDIKVEETNLAINIIEEQEEKPEEPKTEKITSTKYNIEQIYLSRVLPNTTVEQFKQNVNLEYVTTEPKMIFKDKEGKELEESSKLTTGTTIKVGNTLQYTIIVIGDTDGDSEITVNDLAELKLHLLEVKMLDEIKTKAADIDNDNEITINDLAQIKLILINLLELE